MVYDDAGKNGLTERKVQIGECSVPYHFGYDCAETLSDVVLGEVVGCSSIVLILDEQVRAHAKRLVKLLEGGPRIITISLTPSEGNKRLHLVERIIERMVDQGVDRQAVVAGMGGGLVGNIAGMVAALLYRGVPLLHLPTTPVAAFDSVLSAKQAVNLKCGKNLCGTYSTPSLVACDLSWLETVPRHQMLTGFAEIAKNILAVMPDQRQRYLDAIAAGSEYPDRMLMTLLDIGVEAKAPFLAEDPHETGPALVFEYGHTVGHALEFASGGAMLHGEAVAWGMMTAAEVAREFCGLSEGDCQQHYDLVSVLGLSGERLSAIDLGNVKKLLSIDNKRGHLAIGEGSVAMVLLQTLGCPAMVESKPLVAVPLPLVETSIDRVLGGAL